MAHQIVIKKRFTNKLSKLLLYLEQKWSKRIAEDFLQKTEGRLELISRQPGVGTPSQKIAGVKGIHITRHNKLYYKVSDTKVIVLNMYDTRMDPQKKPY